MLVRARESAIADYAPPTSIVEKIFSKLVHKQARTRKYARALRERPGNGDRTWPKQRAPAHAPPRSLCFVEQKKRKRSANHYWDMLMFIVFITSVPIVKLL